MGSLLGDVELTLPMGWSFVEIEHNILFFLKPFVCCGVVLIADARVQV
jgi:hypothetical protein